MSEQEFELYLKLLSRCLGLTANQREQISDELRDHLLERFEELAHSGVPRDQAVLQAIDEFGDAAVLAGHFTTIARLKRRRFLMRLSLGSVAALAAALLVAFAFWPDNRAVQGPQQLVAQEKGKPTKPPFGSPDSDIPEALRAIAPRRATGMSIEASTRKPGHRAPFGAAGKSGPIKNQSPAHAEKEVPVSVEHPLSSDVGEYPKIEAALEDKTDFTIDPEPLKDALEFVATRYHIPIILDAKTLEDASIDTTMEVKLNTSGVKVRQLLSLLFEQLPQPLGYEISDGVLRISTIEKINEHMVVVVYDCRDLMDIGSNAPSAVGRQQTQVDNETSDRPVFSAATPGQPITAAPGMHPNRSSKEASKKTCAAPSSPLISVIRYAGDKEDWNEEERGQNITDFGGLLVVNQNPRVHEKIKRILADLRRMRKEGAFSKPIHNLLDPGPLPVPGSPPHTFDNGPAPQVAPIRPQVSQRG